MSQEQPQTRALVLVVDDRETSRRLICDRLETRGHETVEACDGCAGWQTFQDREPDAVVTDMRMPGGDGLELVERIRGAGPTPVFCITAHPDLDGGLAAMKQGAEYYYRWPQELDRLLDDLDELVRPLSLDEIRASGHRQTTEERRAAIKAALRQTRGNIGQAAELLEVSRRTLYHWLDRYGVVRPKQ